MTIESNMSDTTEINDKLQTLTEDTEQPLILYKRRYIILIILTLALFANGESWMTFGSVTSQSMSYYNTTEQNVNWFGNVFLLAYAIEAIPCTFMPQLIGLKWTIICGCICNFVGLLLRLISLVISDKVRFTNFIISMFGNAILGFGQGFLLNIPSLVSARWFGEKERSLSTAIPFMSNSFGVGVGFVDIFLVMENRASDIDMKNGFLNITIAEFVFSTIILIISLIFVKESPETPPSNSELQKIESSESIEKLKDKVIMVLHNMLQLLKNMNSLAGLLVFAFYYGTYVSVFIFLSSIIGAFVHDSTNLSGYIGSIGIIFGGILITLVGIIMNKTKNKYNRKIGLVTHLLCIIPLVIVLILIPFDKLNNAAAMTLFIIYLGFCPVYIATGCEILADITYPMDANISANEGLILGNIVGVIMTYTIGLINGNAKYYTSLGVAIGLYVLNSIILILIKFQKNRSQIDNVELQKSTKSDENLD